ncbi:hypothetical protein, partial [Ensifer sp. ENS01]|uniref:hypothetical protein n=1 Tax=Ensifer sp. ENS01 TaxID=2769293 RepID=UPI001AED5664
SLVLLQNDDDLFVCETVALHSLVLSMGQSLLQNGLFQRGKVKRSDALHPGSFAMLSQLSGVAGMMSPTASAKIGALHGTR